MFKKLVDGVKYSSIGYEVGWSLNNLKDKSKEKVKDSINYAKEHPVKTAVKTASAVATIYSAGTAISSVKNLGTVVKDVSDSYICGKTASAGEDLSKLWAKLAMKDCANKKLMKKAVTDVAKTATAAKITQASHKR